MLCPCRANSFSPSQEITSNLCQPKLHYRLRQNFSPPIVPTQRHMNPVHVLSSYWRSSITLHSHIRLRHPSDPFLQVFQWKHCKNFPCLPFVLHAPPISYFLKWSPVPTVISTQKHLKGEEEPQFVITMHYNCHLKMSVCCECCVLSGRGLCDALITRPEESYRLCCVAVWDVETSRMRRPWPALGRSATEKKNSTHNILWHIKKYMESLSTNHKYQSREIGLDRGSKLPEEQKWQTTWKPLI